MTDSGPAILVRCAAGRRIGLGHIRRSMALARRLRDQDGCRVTFALSPDPTACGIVRDGGFRFVRQPWWKPHDRWLDGVVRRLRPQGLIVDIRGPELGSQELLRLKQRRGVLVALIDDISERTPAADLVFYPPVPQTAEVISRLGPERARAGWQFTLLDERILQRRRELLRLGRPSRDTCTILVTMGGSDPLALTPLAIEALDAVEAPFDVKVVLGPWAACRESVVSQARRCRHRTEVLVAPPDMPEVLASADLAVASFGVTAYELAALAIPTLLLSISPDHALSASALADAGAAISLGLAAGVDRARLAAAVRDLVVHAEARDTLAKGALAIPFDTDGGSVARAIVDAITQNQGGRR